MKLTKETRNNWRVLGNEGMISALGEYTPTEFLDLLDFLDEIEKDVNRIYELTGAMRFNEVLMKVENLKNKLS